MQKEPKKKLFHLHLVENFMFYLVWGTLTVRTTHKWVNEKMIYSLPFETHNCRNLTQLSGNCMQIMIS